MKATGFRSPGTLVLPGKTKLRGAQTVQRALDILFVFANERPALSTAELAREVALTLPTTHRLLKALQSKGMVVWEKNTRRYSLGPQIARLAGVIMQRDDLVPLVEPWLQELRERSGETASLHWRVGHQRMCIRELVSPQPIRMVSGVGQLYPLVKGAAGKAILASLPAATVEEVIEAERLIGRKRAELLRDLEGIKERGYATSVGEIVPGASAIAAPVVSAPGGPAASINVTGPLTRFTARKLAAVRGLLLESCEEVTRQLSGAGFEATNQRHGPRRS